MTTDDGVQAISDGTGKWRWCWTSPWAVERFGPTTHKTKAAALSAGRKWLKDHAAHG